jgi:thiamine-phosphate pyrophosphorylase
MAKSQQPGPEAAATGLYLVIPATCPPAQLSAALEAADIACVLLLDAGLDETSLRTAIEALCPLAQAREAAVLLQDRAELAAETGCDGVHLSDPEAVAAARKRLGDEAIVGVSSWVGSGVDQAASRHGAMSAAENGADYVAFGAFDSEPGLADTESLGWWQEIMALPCVAFGAATPADCADLATAGADFVAVTPDMDLAACRAACRAALEEAATQA